MIKEENEKMCDVYSKLATGWVDLGHLIESYEGNNIAPLKKAKKKMRQGLDLILSVLPGEEEHDERR
jgi:hypothetical protein